MVDYPSQSTRNKISLNMHYDLLQHLHQFETNSALATQLAQKIAADLSGAIAKRGKATLALSGGSTPKPLLEHLSQLAIDWAKVTVTQVDERWLIETHADSNARLIKEHFLQNQAKAARFISMKTPESSPFAAQTQANEKLVDFAQSIDAVVLGMGADGHTASFFPGADTLANALDPASELTCIAITPPAAPHPRMTLSLAALLRARHMYLHITGEQKLQVLEQAVSPGPDGDNLPIRRVLFRAQPPVQVYYTHSS